MMWSHYILPLEFAFSRPPLKLVIYKKCRHDIAWSSIINSRMCPLVVAQRYNIRVYQDGSKVWKMSQNWARGLAITQYKEFPWGWLNHHEEVKMLRECIISNQSIIIKGCSLGSFGSPLSSLPSYSSYCIFFILHLVSVLIFILFLLVIDAHQ